MRSYAVFAMVSFHAFMAIAGALQALPELEHDGISTMTSFGLAASATLWWITDSSMRRTPVPFASLWIGWIWILTIPVHYFATRGSRGLLKFSLHAGIAVALAISASLTMEPAQKAWASRVTPSDRALAERFGIGEGLLAEIKGHSSNLRPYSPERATDGSNTANGIMFDVESDGSDVVRALRPLTRNGYTVFLARHADPFTREKASVALVRLPSAYDVMRALGTNGDNYGVSTSLIIERLQTWDAQFGVSIVGIGFDWVAIDLRVRPDDVRSFAKELYAFCPDAVDQGTLSLEALEQEIRTSKSVWLWWD